MFNKDGEILYYREWGKTKQGEWPSKNELKLMLGMLIGLKGFCMKISPLDYEINRFSYSTNTYRFHFFETPTLMKIALTTDNSCAPLHEELNSIFQIYVKFVSQDPSHKLGSYPIKNQSFVDKIDAYIQNLPIFSK